jgi:hypothetical protein
MQAWNDMEDARADVVSAELGLDGAIIEYQEMLDQVMSPQVEHQRNCQLHREEEINLYYQCTQNDINNYALHHFGGDARSYPRWVDEYNVCIDHIHSAKHLHLDYYHEDGRVTLEPCDPQTYTSSVYIGEDNFTPAVHHTTTDISSEPLNPYEACDTQLIPDWSGIWIEIWGGTTEASQIMMG